MRLSHSLFACLLCALALLPLPARAAQAAPPDADARTATETVGHFGVIDWQTMRATATGIGVPPAGERDAARARYMAQRAAILDARRNLLEVIGQVHVDSETTVTNFIVQSDMVASRVSGALQGSTVDATHPLRDGSWQAVVSIALTGPLAETLLALPTPAGRNATVQTGPGADTLGQLTLLNHRLQTLEARLNMLHNENARLNQRLDETIAALQAERAAALGTRSEAQAAQNPPPLADQAALAALTHKLAALNDRLAVMEEENGRLAVLASTGKAQPLPPALAASPGGPFALEAPGPPTLSQGPVPATAEATATTAPLPAAQAAQAASAAQAAVAKVGYTGLVVDARDLGFQPNLKPELFGPAGRLYPGPNAHAAQAATRGYVRYYRNLVQAQKSDVAGPLPLTVKATSLAPGKNGALALSEEDAATVQTLSGLPDNVLDQLKVVVVF